MKKTTNQRFSISAKKLKYLGLFEYQFKAYVEAYMFNGLKDFNDKTQYFEFQSFFDNDEEKAKAITIFMRRYIDTSHQVEAPIIWDDYQLDLVSTSCNFGGKRWRLICKKMTNCNYGKFIYCNKPVDILYFSNNRLVCRDCAKLRYVSQNFNRRLTNNRYKQIEYLKTEVKNYEEKVHKRWYMGFDTKKFKRLKKMKYKLFLAHEPYRRDVTRFGESYAKYQVESLKKNTE